MIVQRKNAITTKYKARDHVRAKKINWEAKHTISDTVRKF